MKTSRKKNALLIRLLLVTATMTSVPVFSFTENTALKGDTKHHQLAVQSAQYVANSIDVSADDDKKITITPRALDRRVQIPDCVEPYDFAITKQTESQVNVKIQCKSINWQIFTFVDIETMQQVVMTSTTLSPGTTINSDHVSTQWVDVQRIRRTTFAAIKDVVGSKIQRRIRKDTILSPEILCFVCKGDMVDIIASQSGLMIKAQGIAQQDGVIGETIAIKNSQSQRQIFAKITSASQVSATL